MPFRNQAFTMLATPVEPDPPSGGISLKSEMEGDMLGQVSVQKDGGYWWVVGSAGRRWGRTTSYRKIQKLAQIVAREINASVAYATPDVHAAKKRDYGASFIDRNQSRHRAY